MTKVCTSPLRPRDRIIGAARDLFRKHGIGVGVDAIVDAADSNKMTLYRHFGSKDELIAACLGEAAREAETFWKELEAAHPGDAMAQLEEWVRQAAAGLDSADCNCEMANVAFQLAEGDHPARSVIKEFKKAQQDRLTELCRRAGIAEAELLSNTLVLLVEGARSNRRGTGPEGPSTYFARIAEAAVLFFADEQAAAEWAQKVPAMD